MSKVETIEIIMWRSFGATSKEVSNALIRLYKPANLKKSYIFGLILEVSISNFDYNEFLN